jgi:hypothetical protein
VGAMASITRSSRWCVSGVSTAPSRPLPRRTDAEAVSRGREIVPCTVSCVQGVGVRLYLGCIPAHAAYNDNHRNGHRGLHVDPGDEVNLSQACDCTTSVGDLFECVACVCVEQRACVSRLAAADHCNPTT